MANMAFTSYYIDGDENEFKDLFSRLRSGLLHQPSGTISLGLPYVASLIGCNTEDIDKRSSFIFIEGERGKYINFRTESPFTRDEAFERAFREKYPKLKLYFEEDATDSAGVFRTNDKDHKYFKGNEYYLDDAENGSEHFDDAKTMISHFMTTYNVQNIEDITDLKEYIYHFNDVYGRDIVLYKKQYV